MAIQGLEFEKPTLVDGGHEQKAIVNTASGKQPVNAPTVEDIKRIAKGEAEESSATEWEKSIKNHLYVDQDGYVTIEDQQSGAKIKIGSVDQQTSKVIIEDQASEGKIEINLLNKTIDTYPDDDWAFGNETEFNSISASTVYCEYLSNEGDIDVDDLQRGERIYQHKITLYIRKNNDEEYLDFVVYNSSNEEIDDLIKLEAIKELLPYTMAAYSGADTYKIVCILHLSNGEISIRDITGVDYEEIPITDVLDTIIQC